MICTTELSSRRYLLDILCSGWPGQASERAVCVMFQCTWIQDFKLASRLMGHGLFVIIPRDSARKYVEVQTTLRVWRFNTGTPQQRWNLAVCIGAEPDGFEFEPEFSWAKTFSKCDPEPGNSDRTSASDPHMLSITIFITSKFVRIDGLEAAKPAWPHPMLSSMLRVFSLTSLHSKKSLISYCSYAPNSFQIRNC